MSQKLNTMKLIENESGIQGLVLRPLSARVLDETIPEIKGWIKRDKLLAINGRGRKEQIALANEYGINDYPCPSGGCLLTDPQFSKRLKDLMRYGQLNLNDIQLLKIGRHFRLTDRAKLVVGRDERENKKILNLAKDNDYLFFPGEDLAGPTSLGKGGFSNELIGLASSIAAFYCDLNGDLATDIIYKRIPEKEDKIFNTLPIEESKLVGLRI